jgi:pimeloyl-ACP methyl ester carboxylesterase
VSTWVFLRGLTRESRHWGSFPETFRQAVPEADVHTIDLPGNGRLHRLKSPADVAEMAESCRAQLLASGIPPPYHVLAMSLGAMVTIAWAACHPAEIRGGVLINTSLRQFSPFHQRLKPGNYLPLIKLLLTGASPGDWERTILQLTSRHAARPASLLNDWTAFRAEYPVSFSNACRQLLAAARYRAPLKQPAAPMLVLASKADGLVDPRCSRGLAARWHTAFAEHPTAGHDIPLDDGPWVADQVSRWLHTLDQHHP